MSAREAMTVLLGVTSLVALGWMAAGRMVRTASRGVVQVLAGATCGAVCAVVAAAPYVDLVPDGAESEVGVVTGALAVAVVAAWGWRAAALRRPQPSRRRRSPGEPCAAASSEQSGP